MRQPRPSREELQNEEEEQREGLSYGLDTGH